MEKPSPDKKEKKNKSDEQRIREKIKKWLPYLPEKEKIYSYYQIGSSDVVTTSDRILCLRSFPESFTEVGYGTVSSLEHKTRIMLAPLIKTVILASFMSYLYNLSMSDEFISSIRDLVLIYAPQLSSILPIKTAVNAVLLLVFIATVMSLIGFITSFRGELRISRKDHAPIRIRTGFTPQVKALIKEIQMNISEYERRTGAASSKVSEADERESTITPAIIYNKLKEGVGGLPSGAITLVSCKSRDRMTVVTSLMESLVKERVFNVLYISISQPYIHLIDSLREMDIDSSKIIFIDCVSQMAGKLPEKVENTVFVENPSSLEEVDMYVDKLLARLTEPKLIFLDSISSFMIYNNEQSVKEFLHLLINKMRIGHISGVILSIEKKEVEGLVNTILPLCDKEIRV